ncbi:hypothetical protein [Marinobacter algicola]|uniref:SPOR domain-containing protein n=1 Tax=Marinobacter algicola DG893 TaxID=443152 RepID=A6F190_9GAMM|nr:hypothetical protein [Marinobacter algicola]EDM47539.1 hypothetical protein MDG893_13899 [Marinobacter algicola DG893]
MRWFAVALILINGALWLYGDKLGPKPVAVVTERQALPRVADLKPLSPEADLEAAGNDVMLAEGEAAQAAVDVPPEREEVPLSFCVRLGWFDSKEGARKAYRSLGRPGTDYDVNEEERELAPLHWVIIPPQPEDRALDMFRNLQRRGIDSYLVTRGENKNAISLGLFESRRAAENVLAEKKRQNLNAILANFPRNQLSYALVFEDQLVPDSGAVGVAETDYSENFDMVEIRRCEGVATRSENP